MIICPHCQSPNLDASFACTTCGAPLEADPVMAGDPFIGRVVGGRFELKSIVGSGEIGLVYRGLDQRSGQAVAVKIIHPDVASTHGDELLRTAGEVARLRHAKLAAVFAASREVDGTTFVVTEFLLGETLKSLLERGGPLSGRRAADVLFQICSALAPIHRVGRPHANLKPENVFLVEKPDGTDSVKICDAGSPDLFGVRDTYAGTVIIGTPKYFSPEQAIGRPVDLASDQFTLGIIGYQLMTGALPFFGATPDQLLAAIANGTPTPVSQRVPGSSLPPRLAETIHRCLEKSPAARYPDLRALATDLAAVIKTTQIEPEPTRPKRKGFGIGAQISTVIANPDMLAGLTGHSASAEFDEDEDRTVMRLEESTRDLSRRPLGATPVPTQGDYGSIPEPLMFTGALDSDDLASALAQATASVGRGGSRLGPAVVETPAAMPAFPDNLTGGPTMISPQGGPRLDFSGDLAAAMGAAVRELGDEDVPRRPRSAPAARISEPALRPAPPAPRISEPALRPEPPRNSEPAPRQPEPTARRSFGPPSPPQGASPADILNAIDEELDTHQQSPQKAPAQALATAADFAVLTIPPPNQQPRPVRPNANANARSPLLALVGLLVVAAVGAGVWYFVLREEEPVASAPARPKPKAPVLKLVRLETDPPGAEVYVGDEKIQQVTPTELKPDKAITYTFKLAGHQDQQRLVDPATFDATNPQVVHITLAPVAPADAGAEPAKPDDAAVAKPSTDVATPVRKPPRRRVPRLPNPDDIKDPFATP